jgi:hypothetical protein
MEQATAALELGATLALVGAHWSTGIGKAILIAPSALVVGNYAAWQVGAWVGKWAMKDNRSSSPAALFGPEIAGLVPGALALMTTFATVEYCAMRWL